MAERPVFIPSKSGGQLVREIAFSFKWHSGFAVVQKQKNIAGLHEAAAHRGYSPLLEVSTKSLDRLGQRLSAFNLRVGVPGYGDIPLECAYQGSKVFERSGPHQDLYLVEPRAAKRDSRVRDSGRITGFRFGDIEFPSDPKTAFYDWLYSRAIFPHRDYLTRLNAFAGFTDIEFNPSRSLNCQARACAIFVAMAQRGVLADAQDPDRFVALLRSGHSDVLPGDRAFPERSGHSELFSGLRSDDHAG